ncbi:histidine kinase [Actinoplanes sp. NBRC 103695]|uniref:sensor histidine kinase n=1 Tax=Actinoplanes sp. NBRC 103695 TaxID=3032202 RepID=UPI0025522B43|nr:histidine kinase [Actinoplanes sp. NBRC 103695]
MPKPGGRTALGAALLAGQAAVAVAGIRQGVAPVHVAAVCWLTAAYTVSGLIAWRHRPGNRFGPLMVLTGAGSLASSVSWLHQIGLVADLVPLILIVHVFLSYPSGRLTSRLARVLLGIGYVAAVGVHVVSVALDFPAVLYQGELLLVGAVALAGAALMVARRRTRPLRRSLTVLIDAFTLGLVMIAVLLVVGVLGGPAFPAVQRLAIVLLGVAPVVFLAGLLQARLARGSIGDLVLELREDPADLGTPLARALRDPSLRLLYWLPDFDAWAGEDGRPATLPDDPDRVTVIEEHRTPVAALVHDPALRDEADLLAAVTAAAAIAVRTGRLQAQLRANVEELRGSRARVAEAGRRERRRLERDLHDGAQQRLVALSLNLGVLQTRLGDDADALALVREARAEIATSLAELRDVAHGLHPAVVSAHGLAVALESLTVRAPVPVRLTVDLGCSPSEAVEVAAYYVVSECLTNVGKHAAASSATVDVRSSEGTLVIEVVDDGRGGADAERGSGLRGLADRVETLGGRLRVWTPPDQGTRVRAELPCE